MKRRNAQHTPGGQPEAEAQTRTRRTVMQLAAGLGAGLLVWPPARAAEPDLSAAVAAYTGGIKPTPGKVKIAIAELVDNGNVVPVSVTVESAMTALDHVKTLAIFNERNPQRDVARFVLGLRYGKPQLATRIRLATSQKLMAVAQMSDGSYWYGDVDVIVTLAACIE